MRKIAAAWALTALASAAPAIALAEPPARCPITVEFGSYCCGPDVQTQRRMQDLLARTEFRRVRVDVYGWGMEGESTWCIRPGAASARLLTELRRIARSASPSRSHPAPVVRLDAPAQGTLRGPLTPR